MIFNPQPKRKRIKLSQKEYSELREDVCGFAGYQCESCGKYLPLDRGTIHHIKTRGAGGDDIAENCQWLCLECHRFIHDNGIRGNNGKL